MKFRIKLIMIFSALSLAALCSQTKAASPPVNYDKSAVRSEFEAKYDNAPNEYSNTKDIHVALARHLSNLIELNRFIREITPVSATPFIFVDRQGHITMPSTSVDDIQDSEDKIRFKKEKDQHALNIASLSKIIEKRRAILKDLDTLIGTLTGDLKTTYRDLQNQILKDSNS